MGSYWREVGGEHVGGSFLRGVMREPMGATQRVASRREEGQQWKERRVPLASSEEVTSQCSFMVGVWFDSRRLGGVAAVALDPSAAVGLFVRCGVEVEKNRQGLKWKDLIYKCKMDSKRSYV